MKTRAAALVFLLAAARLAEAGAMAAEAAKPPTPTPPPALLPEAPAPAASEKVVALSPLKVTESRDKLLREMIEKEESAPPDRFTLKEGGAVVKKAGRKTTTELGLLKYDPAKPRSITLFRLSW